MAENYYQHAEHYYRIITAIQEAEAQQRGRNNPGANGNGHAAVTSAFDDGDDEEVADGEGDGGRSVTALND